MTFEEAQELRRRIREERPDIAAMDSKGYFQHAGEYVILVRAMAPSKARDTRTGKVRSVIRHSDTVTIFSAEDWEQKKDSIRVPDAGEMSPSIRSGSSP